MSELHNLPRVLGSDVTVPDLRNLLKSPILPCKARVTLDARHSKNAAASDGRYPSSNTALRISRMPHAGGLGPCMDLSVIDGTYLQVQRVRVVSRAGGRITSQNLPLDK